MSDARPTTARRPMSNGGKVTWGAIAVGTVAVITILAWLGVRGPKDYELKEDHRADIDRLDARNAAIEKSPDGGMRLILEELRKGRRR